MEHPRDEAIEAMLGDIIAKGSDSVLSYLNDTDGLEGQGEEDTTKKYTSVMIRVFVTVGRVFCHPCTSMTIL